jgi:GH35 family endo-1,4-beta-xylanase
MGAGLGLYETAVNWQREFGLAQSLGLGVVRLNLDVWDMIQPTAKTFDFTNLDMLVEAVRYNDMDLIFTTPISAKWNRPATADSHTPTTDMLAVKRLITAVASRYRGEIKYYEAWNEPDYHRDGVGIFWKPAPDPVAYMTYLKTVSAAVRREDPDAKIMNGGFAMPLDRAFQVALKNAGMRDYVDIINTHIYPAYASPDAAIETAEEIFGAGVPIMVTETSSTGAKFDTTDLATEERRKCGWLARTYNKLLARPNVVAVVWHTLRNPPGMDFGLLANDFTPLPAFTAHRAFTDAVKAGAQITENAQDVMGAILTADAPIYVFKD